MLRVKIVRYGPGWGIVMVREKLGPVTLSSTVCQTPWMEPLVDCPATAAAESSATPMTATHRFFITLSF
jgi:hypothetical protein